MLMAFMHIRVSLYVSFCGPDIDVKPKRLHYKKVHWNKNKKKKYIYNNNKDNNNICPFFCIHKALWYETEED